MIKLTDLLKEITEAKQVGDLYHFTPLSNLKKILATRFLYANEEGHLSTSIRPNMDISVLNKLKNAPVARIMLDGNKISNKYKIQPFAYGGDFSPESIEDLGEEQIILNDNKFYFTPYLKRIDIFLNKKETIDPKMLELLEKANIPYKIYQGTPIANVPYNQPKTGNPKDINIDNIPEKKIYTKNEIYYPNMKTTSVEIYANPEAFKYRDKYKNNKLTVGISPDYPNYYLIHSNSKDSEYRNWVNSKGEKINTKTIPIPMYDDPKWQKMWKQVDSSNSFFRKGLTSDIYYLIPKNEVV